MIDSTKYRYHLLVFIIMVLVASRLNAQGLQFYGNKVPIEQRTSYRLFDGERRPAFTGHIDIEFDLRISQSSTFGYLFHLIDPANGEAYSLTYSYVNDSSSSFNFNTEGKVNHISISLSNDSIISQWMPVKLRIDFLGEESVLSVADKVKRGVGVGNLPKQIQPLMSFGRREHLVDVPAFAIRHLKVKGETQFYSFEFKENSGNDVHDSNGRVQGRVDNPYWLINDSYHWTKVAAFTTPQCVGSKFYEKRQEVVFITPDSLFTYLTDKRQVVKKPYANKQPVSMLLGTSFINEANGEVYAYEINNLPVGSTTIAALNLDTRGWRPVGKAYTKVQLHHHNGFWDGANNRYIVFGGFGNRLYSNKFLMYNETTDQWDTLQFKGDTITPRFFSSMGSSRGGDYLYIYGGVGNESGDQSIGHNYYNDLYRVDLKHQEIKRNWSHPLEEKCVPSGQMLLSKDEKSLYVIRYAEYKKTASLRLYKISIENGEVEQLGDSIPFASGSIASTVSLYHNSVLSEFYCVTEEFNEQAKLVEAAVYTLADSPVGRADMGSYLFKTKTTEEWKVVLWIGALLFISGGIGGFWYSRRKQRRKLSPVVPVMVYEGNPIKENLLDKLVTSGTPVPVSHKRTEINQIYVYGIFTIYNRDGRDVTYLFSNKLRLIFLYILLNSAEEGEGVSSSLLNDIFWPDKREDKAKNLKGVTISNLRKVLAELDGIKLVYDKGAFKIEIEENLCFCDYYRLSAHLRKHPQSCELFLSIWERGRLLENIDHSLFDKYKQNSEDTVLSLLPKDLANYYQRNEFRNVLRICFIILKRDPLNELALGYSMRSYKRLNDFESLSKIYSAFIIEYRKSMGEDYAKTMDDLLR